MALILGIDAAWTKAQFERYCTLGDAMEDALCSWPIHSTLSFSETMRATAKIRRHAAQCSPLLRKAESIAGAAVDLVAIDMPMAHTRITGRRVADNAISVAFSAQ